MSRTGRVCHVGWDRRAQAAAEVVAGAGCNALRCGLRRVFG
ncbi:hypothetical protein BURMUCGD1_0086 [Burkholderia multivorans CGD1]|nr:hypothetical protein BURMUCGD1_0086 [Burkholderia multivorans CGD1]